MKKRWHSVLILGLVLLFVTSNIGCPTGFTQENLDAKYNEGHNDGYAVGYDEGESDGYTQGFSAGEESGLIVGHVQGEAEGLIQGKAEGYAQGYSVGWLEGYQVGLQECEEPTTDLFIEIVFLSTPIPRGNFATLRAETLPNAYCTITVQYQSGPGTADGLKPTPIANSAGIVSWTWLVSGNTTPGSWLCAVTASLGGEYDADSRYIEVTS